MTGSLMPSTGETKCALLTTGQSKASNLLVPVLPPSRPQSINHLLARSLTRLLTHSPIYPTHPHTLLLCFMASSPQCTCCRQGSCMPRIASALNNPGNVAVLIFEKHCMQGSTQLSDAALRMANQQDHSKCRNACLCLQRSAQLSGANQVGGWRSQSCNLRCSGHSCRHRTAVQLWQQVWQSLKHKVQGGKLQLACTSVCNCNIELTHSST